jgi:hypothetical protein
MSRRRRTRSRRSNPLYALAVLLLVPATVGYLYWVEARSFGADGPGAGPITAAEGAALTYQGTTWKLTYTGKGPVRDGERLPDDARLIFATIEVTPSTAEAGRRIESCGFEATDGAGRTWRSDTLPADLEALDDPATGCYSDRGEFGTGPIRAGEKQPVLAVFLVPKDAVPDLRVLVSLGLDDPPLELAS